MPIANCFITENEVNLDGLDNLAREWAGKISTDVNDITINIIPSFKQIEQTYSVMLNLYLRIFGSPMK